MQNRTKNEQLSGLSSVQQLNGNSNKFQVVRSVTNSPGLTSTSSTTLGSLYSSSSIFGSASASCNSFACDTSHSSSHGSGSGIWSRDATGTIVCSTEVSRLTPVQTDVDIFSSTVSAENQKLLVDSRDGNLSQVGANFVLSNMYPAGSNLASAKIDVSGLSLSGFGRDCIASPSSEESQVVPLGASVNCLRLPDNKRGGTDEDSCSSSFARCSNYSATCSVISDYIDACKISIYTPAELSSAASQSASASALSASGTIPSFINKVCDSGSFGILQQSDDLHAAVDQNLAACEIEAEVYTTKQVVCSCLHSFKALPTCTCSTSLVPLLFTINNELLLLVVCSGRLIG